MRVRSWIIALLGLWEFADIIGPFFPGFGHVQAFVRNHIIVGLILVIAGVWSALTSNVATAKTMNWIAAVAGAWLIIAPLFWAPRYRRRALERYHRWRNRLAPRRLVCSYIAAGSWLEGVLRSILCFSSLRPLPPQGLQPGLSKRSLPGMRSLTSSARLNEVQA